MFVAFDVQEYDRTRQTRLNDLRSVPEKDGRTFKKDAVDVAELPRTLFFIDKNKKTAEINKGSHNIVGKVYIFRFDVLLLSRDNIYLEFKCLIRSDVCTCVLLQAVNVRYKSLICSTIKFIAFACIDKFDDEYGD